MKEEIEHFYDYLQRLLLNEDLSIPSKNFDLVLDIMVTDDERISWSYYYACHDARCLFWLETYDASYMISELFGVKSPAHVSALHLSHPELLVVSTNAVCRAPFGVPLLVGLSSTGFVDVRVDIVWIGIIGHSFQSLLKVVIFHLTFMTSLWGS
jgi:hypothetical protein